MFRDSVRDILTYELAKLPLYMLSLGSPGTQAPTAAVHTNSGTLCLLVLGFVVNGLRSEMSAGAFEGCLG